MTKEIIQNRHERYGSYKDNAGLVQVLKDAVHARPGWSRMNATQRESADMILVKVARIVAGNPSDRDSWQDIVGYATLILNEIDNGASEAFA